MSGGTHQPDSRAGWRVVAGAHLVTAVGFGSVFSLGGTGALLVRRRTDRTENHPATAAGLGPIAAWRLPGLPLMFLVIVLGSVCVFIPYVHLVPIIASAAAAIVAAALTLRVGRRSREPAGSSYADSGDSHGRLGR